MEVLYGSKEMTVSEQPKRDLKRPIMLEVLDLFNFVTPSTIRLKQMQFQKANGEEINNKALVNGKGYTVNIVGEISEGGSRRASIMLQNYLYQLNNLNLFEGISLESGFSESNKRLSFELRATL
ncbi:MAG: hypothetical protein ACRBF0_00165 [Calditrichia bacterium]